MIGEDVAAAGLAPLALALRRLGVGAEVVGLSTCRYVTRISPPELAPPTPEDRHYDGATARVRPAYLARRGKLWVMQVKGSPAQLGYRHARLTKSLMTEGDRRMHDLFTT